MGQTEIYRCSWGVVGPGAPWTRLSDFIPQAAADGYFGVEFPLAHMAFEEGPPEAQLETVRRAIAGAGLAVIPLIATRPAQWGDVAGHLQAFSGSGRAGRATGRAQGRGALRRRQL